MFEQIKSSLNNKKHESAFKDVLKFEAGKTYVVRLLPNIDKPSTTIYHYYHHSWESLTTGRFVTALCPTTYGEKCPIDAYTFKTYKSGPADEKAALSKVSRKENWMVNVYVVTDPSNPTNEGQVKILRYGQELNKIITSALEGDDADEFGAKVFDLKNGCSLKIKCESRVDSRKGNSSSKKNFMTTYASSKFMGPSTLDLTDDKVEEILNATHKLEDLIKPKTTVELQQMLDEHFLCTFRGAPVEVAETENDDDGDSDETPKAIANTTEIDDVFAGVTEASAPDDTDENLKKLLADLD